MEQSEEKNKGKIKMITITSIESDRVRIAKIEDAYRIFTTLFRYEEEFFHDKEHLWVLAVDDQGYASCVYIAALGMERISVANAFDLFKVSLHYNVKKIIIAHNQIDEGDPKPQESDLDYTNRIWHKARIINVEFEDHIIITKDSINSEDPIYYSYKEHGLVEIIAQDIKYKSVDESEEELERQREDYHYDKLKKEKEKIAKKMFAKNVSIEDIMEFVGLSEKEVTNIKLKYIENTGKAFEE